jgi:hypothetical protein
MKLLILVVAIMGLAFPPALLCIPILLIAAAIDRKAAEKEADRVAFRGAARSLKEIEAELKAGVEALRAQRGGPWTRS